MHGDLDSNLTGEGRGESVFESITRCITFDRKHFAKDIEIFERALEHAIDTRGYGMYRN